MLGTPKKNGKEGEDSAATTESEGRERQTSGAVKTTIPPRLFKGLDSVSTWNILGFLNEGELRQIPLVSRGGVQTLQDLSSLAREQTDAKQVSPHSLFGGGDTTIHALSFLSLEELARVQSTCKAGFDAARKTSQRYSPLFSVSAMSCGRAHTAIVYLGKLYVWGDGHSGQLGLGQGMPPQKTPQIVEDLPSLKTVTCGGDVTLVVTQNGEVYSCGTAQGGALGSEESSVHWSFTKVETISNVANIASSGVHTLALTEDKRVYVWGSCQNGQLGLGEDVATQSVPTEIISLREKGIVAIACSSNHSVVLTEAGEVYTWGANRDWQLGFGDSLTCSTPHLVQDVLQGKKVISISCGKRHTVVVTDEGEVYTWGDCRYAQLGTEDRVPMHTPQLVTTLKGKGIVAVSCGEYCTIARTHDGQLYAWGYSGQGELGLGPEVTEPKHCLVYLPKQVETLTGVREVVCGSSHTVAITKEGVLYSWGSDLYGQLGYRPQAGTTQSRSIPAQVTRFQYIDTSELDDVVSRHATSKSESTASRLEQDTEEKKESPEYCDGAPMILRRG